jgi:hypothetical protein
MCCEIQSYKDIALVYIMGCNRLVQSSSMTLKSDNAEKSDHNRTSEINLVLMTDYNSTLKCFCLYDR